MKSGKCYFYSRVARLALDAIDAGKESVTLSVDLNLSCKQFLIRDSKLVLDETKIVPADMLRKIAPLENRIFLFENQALKPLEVRRKGYFKLVPTDTAPGLEIDGVKMHRSKTIDPLEDARKKAEKVVVPGGALLDTCGGLGYSAALALKLGASSVVSVEKSREVIHLRELNPWLETFDLSGLRLIHGDITQEIDSLEGAFFKSVIHDPPRFSSATGDLYGKPFYQALFRVMAQGGRLFHYTGTPKKIKNGDRFVKNTMKRLEVCGFEQLEFIDGLQGIYAQKPMAGFR